MDIGIYGFCINGQIKFQSLNCFYFVSSVKISVFIINEDLFVCYLNSLVFIVEIFFKHTLNQILIFGLIQSKKENES